MRYSRLQALHRDENKENPSREGERQGLQKKGKTQRTDFATVAKHGRDEKCHLSQTVRAAEIHPGKGTKPVTPPTLEWTSRVRRIGRLWRREILVRFELSPRTVMLPQFPITLGRLGKCVRTMA